MVNQSGWRWTCININYWLTLLRLRLLLQRLFHQHYWNLGKSIHKKSALFLKGCVSRSCCSFPEMRYLKFLRFSSRCLLINIQYSPQGCDKGSLPKDFESYSGQTLKIYTNQLLVSSFCFHLLDN
jgi:hypothetical protein